MNYIKKLSILFFTIALIISVTGCSKIFGTESDPEENVGGTGYSVDELEEMSDEDFAEAIDNGIVFEEEAEGADLHFKKSSELDYIGKWTATSGQSIYMYGNVDLDIKSNGKWSGNVAGEGLSGSWTFEQNALQLHSELFNASLSFTDDGTLVMQENRDDEDDVEEYINTVLTKK